MSVSTCYLTHIGCENNPEREERNKMFTAYFDDRKETFDSMEGAMDWMIDQAKRFGMTGPEAIKKGYGDIFNG